MKKLSKLLLILTLIFAITPQNVAAMTSETLYMPPNSGFKAYMGYKAITNKASIQYALSEASTTDSKGLRTFCDRYCVAVGTGLNAPLGSCIDVILSTGVVLHCLVGDIKSDKHTDPTHIMGANTNIIEFIVDTANLDKTAKRAGDISYIPGFEGSVYAVIVYRE